MGTIASHPAAATVDPAGVFPVQRSTGETEKVTINQVAYGREEDFAETPDVFTTTNTGAVTAAKIPLLICNVTGTGMAGDLRFSGPSARHSVADTLIVVGLIINTVAARSHNVWSRNVSQGPGVEFTRRLVLTAGVEYTFEVGVQLGAAGTGLLGASATSPIELGFTLR